MEGTQSRIRGYRVTGCESRRTPILFMEYYCDDGRHLVCIPYSIPNLHKMAADLNIKRCWFHSGRLAHYDIPKTRIAEIAARCTVVTQREIYKIIVGYTQLTLALDERT